MNILTGIACVVFALLYFAARGSSDRREAELYARIASVSFIVLLLLGGHWIAVLLGRL